MKTVIAALVLAYAIFFTCEVGTFGMLPERIATHFDIAGQPNGWMSRGTYLHLMAWLAVLTPLPLLVIMPLCSWLTKDANRSDPATIERRRETAFVVQRFVIGFGALLVLFFAGMHLLVVVANEGPGQPRLSASGIWGLAALFTFSALLWTVPMVRRLMRLG
jgi:uncharacterized membrane protein